MDKYIKMQDVRAVLLKRDWTPTKWHDIKRMLSSIPAAKVREDIPAEWVELNIYTSDGNVDMLQSARCSKCEKYHTTPYSYYFDHYNFCPNCGARMTSQREDGNGT